VTASVRPLPVGAIAPFVLPADGGSLAADLHELARVWSSAPDAAELRALPADPSARAHEELLRGADRVVDEGLALLLQRARDRGEGVPLRPTWVAVRTVRGLLVSRLLGRPLDPAVVPDLVDRVLLPLLRSGLHPV
jgi:hypothetical protein